MSWSSADVDLLWYIFYGTLLAGVVISVIIHAGMTVARWHCPYRLPIKVTSENVEWLNTNIRWYWLDENPDVLYLLRSRDAVLFKLTFPTDLVS